MGVTTKHVNFYNVISKTSSLVQKEIYSQKQKLKRFLHDNVHKKKKGRGEINDKEKYKAENLQ